MVVSQEQRRIKALNKPELWDFCKQKGLVAQNDDIKQFRMAQLQPLAFKYTEDKIAALTLKSQERIAKFAPPEIASQFLGLGEIEAPAQDINALEEPIWWYTSPWCCENGVDGPHCVHK